MRSANVSWAQFVHRKVEKQADRFDEVFSPSISVDIPVSLLYIAAASILSLLTVDTMKLLRYSLFLFLLSPPVSLANGWDVILLSGEAFLDVKVTELRNDSIQIQTTEWIDWFWLGNIARIERKSTAWGEGAALGGLIGFVGGGWYAVENQEKTIDQPPVVRGVLGGVIGAAPGGLLGALIGGMINTGASYDFTRMSYDERIAVARKIILNN